MLMHKMLALLVALLLSASVYGKGFSSSRSSSGYSSSRSSFSSSRSSSGYSSSRSIFSSSKSTSGYSSAVKPAPVATPKAQSSGGGSWFSRSSKPTPQTPPITTRVETRTVVVHDSGPSMLSQWMMWDFISRRNRQPVVVERIVQGEPAVCRTVDYVHLHCTPVEKSTCPQTCYGR